MYLNPSSALPVSIFLTCHDDPQCEVCLQTPLPLRINSLPDTSISPFLQFSTPPYQTYTEAFQQCSRTLLSSTLISGLPSWHCISNPRPFCTSLQRLTQARPNSFFRSQKNIFSPPLSLLMQIVLGRGRYIRKLKLSTCPGTLRSVWKICFFVTWDKLPVTQCVVLLQSSGVDAFHKKTIHRNITFWANGTLVTFHAE